MNQDILEILPVNSPLKGTIEIPADKSISHRAAIFGSLCDGTVKVNNFSSGADCRSSVHILKTLGINIEQTEPKSLLIYGKGLNGLAEPSNILDAGNSGTTIRLMLGILSGQNFYSVITGDDSLRTRPMGRVISPLKAMGASIIARKDNTLAPVTILPAKLTGIEYQMPIASAQVKSAILLAGLFASGSTKIIEPAKSRDHTERMLKYLGVDVNINDFVITVKGNQNLVAKELTIPGDISSASFFIVAATIVKDSSVTITNVGINPTRTGLISIMEQMGANITIVNEREVCGEPVGDIVVQSARLKGIEIGGEVIPTLIDEIPIISVAAGFAEGTTIIRDAQDLRNKESDRLKTTANELRKLGFDIEETLDGLIINGKNNIEGGSICESHHDHRIAMALAIAGLATNKPVTINNASWIKISFPEFMDTLSNLREKEYDKQVF